MAIKQHRKNSRVAEERVGRILIRTTDSEIESIRLKALEADLPVATYVRNCALNSNSNRKGRFIKCDPELIRQLSKIGNNINQIAYKLNKNELESLDILSSLALVSEQLKQIKEGNTYDYKEYKSQEKSEESL